VRHNVCRTMDQYPRFSFRLTPEILRKVDMLARVRNRTRAQVVREAVEFYFAARICQSEESLSP
jgi:predicted transcriptional regulator